MKNQDLQYEVNRIAEKFTLRTKRSAHDEKRHDRVRKDEAKAMLKIEEKFGLTSPKIAEIFHRDTRTVMKKLKEAKEGLQKGEEVAGADIRKKARLQIEFDPRRPSELGLIQYTCSPLVRKFARVSVRNIGETTALRSWGILRIIAPKEALEKYPRDLKLHWVDTPYDLDTDSAEPVDIAAGTHRLLDVAFSQPRKEDMPKLEELQFGQSLTSGQPYSVTVHRPESAEWELSIPSAGCWVANPIALANPSTTAPGYMPPDSYVVEVVVGCENGQGDAKCFEIVSPLNWQDLDMIPVTPP